MPQKLNFSFGKSVILFSQVLEDRGSPCSSGEGFQRELHLLFGISAVEELLSLPPLVLALAVVAEKQSEHCWCLSCGLMKGGMS